MKLYSGPLSLFSRKVEIALHEKGLAFEQVLVPFTQTKGYDPRNPDVLAINPKGQVPVLVDRALWPRLMSLEGDEGAQRLWQAHPEWVNEVWFSDLAPRDVDTETDIVELRPKHPGLA